MSAQRRLIPIVASLAILAPAPAAHAKGVAQATVCGAGGCSDVTQRAQPPAGCSGCSGEQMMSVLPASAQPARRAPWVRVVLALGAGGEVMGRERFLWSPELELEARPDGSGGWAWFRPTPEALAVAHRIVRDIEPYPAASMPFEPAAAPVSTPRPADPTRSADAADWLLPGSVLVVAALAIAGSGTLLRRRRAGAT